MCRSVTAPMPSKRQDLFRRRIVHRYWLFVPSSSRRHSVLREHDPERGGKVTRNRLLLVQTGTPPTAIRQAHGDLPRWFRTLLAPWQTQLTTVRVFEDEPLPTPDNQTIAVLTKLVGDGNRSSGVERTDRRLDPAGGGYRHAAVRRLLWSSTDGPCPGGRGGVSSWRAGKRQPNHYAVAMGYRCSAAERPAKLHFLRI